MSSPRAPFRLPLALAVSALAAATLSFAQAIPLARADVDRDCTVTRSDATLVQASLNRRAGMPGFNPAADVNGDGVVNNIDLTFVARNVGASVCAPANRPPAFTSQPVTTVTRLERYVYAAAAADADRDPLVFSLPTAPPGMTIDPSSGRITWTPPATGTFDIVVRVDDGKGGSATQPFSLVASAPPNRPPLLRPIGTQQIPAGVPFGTVLSADDPDVGDSLTFSLTSAPPGATLSPSPRLAWTPTASQTGVQTFAVTVTDAAGASDSGTFTLDVVARNEEPVLDAQPDATIVAEAAYSRLLSATDPDPGDTLTYTLVSGPSGLTVAGNGALTWTPTSAQLGSHLVKVSVADSGGLADAAAFTLTVDVPAPVRPPVAADDAYAVRRQATLRVDAPGVLANDSDPAGLPLSAQIVTPPSKGMATLSPDGALTYTPTPPAAGSTEPKLRYAVSYRDAGGILGSTYAQPLVADLDGDGEAEIVFLSLGAFADRRLIAVHGSTGAIAWATNVYQPLGTPPFMMSASFTQLAAADLDGDGHVEILAVDSDDETSRLRNRIIAFNYDGTLRWKSDDVIDGVNVLSTSGLLWPKVADLDGDGSPEIVALLIGKSPQTPPGVVGEDLVTVFDPDGHLRWTKRVPGTSSGAGDLTVADVDLDGVPEIVIGNAVLDNRANVKWNVKPGRSAAWFVAVGNLDDDPFGEIVFQDVSGNLYCYEHNGARKWGPVGQRTLSTSGTPTIADADGDGRAEILRPQDGVEIWDRNGNLSRVMSLPDTYRGNGGAATVFDLNGDGKPEVIYVGSQGPFDQPGTFTRGALYIFDGSTGSLLHSLPSSRNGSEETHGAIVADVDGDGTAEIVTGGWSEQPALLRVFGAATGRWAETRPIWNQMDYHVTNVERDGTIPAHEAVNWLTPGLNIYRGNVPLPEERTGDRDELTYVASNGSATSNLATVRLDILPPNTAPRILSLAPTAAATGVEYVYAVRASDPDVGESLAFSLPIAPAGMTIDGNTGLVRWTPTVSAGSPANVVVKVTDSQGESDAQQFQLTIGAAVLAPSVIGDDLPAAQATLTSAGLTLGAASASPSATMPAGQILSQEPAPGAAVPAGAAVAVVVSSGPAPAVVPNVVGRNSNEAIGTIGLFGFGVTIEWTFSSTIPTGRVAMQAPAPGTLQTGGSVAIQVSAGPGLTVRLARDLTSAGESIVFTTTAYDLSFVEQPAPALTYQITPAIVPSFGAMPTVSGNAILTSPDTRGAFTLTVTDPASGRSVGTGFAVTIPRTPGQPAMTDAFADFSDAIETFSALLREARADLVFGDTAPLRSLLDRMVRRWRQVDTLRLGFATPYALQEGFFPAPADAEAFGLRPTADDLVGLQIVRDSAADLRAWIAGLREPSTSIVTLRQLADRFNTRAARLSSVTFSEWGAIKTAPTLTVIVTELLPEFFTALADDLAAVVAHSSGGPGPSLLAEETVVVAIQEQLQEIAEGPIAKYRQDVMKQAAWSAAAVAAAHHFKTWNGVGGLDAIVAGASMSVHLFKSGWSFLEGNLDTDEPANNVVITLGPDNDSELLAAPDPGSVTETIKAGFSTVENAAGIFAVMSLIYAQMQADVPPTSEGFGLVANAFQVPSDGYKGCVFSSAPACGQLVFDEGFQSVYSYSSPEPFQQAGFTGIPAPIIFLVYDKTTGSLTVDLAEFLPTKE